MEFKSSVFIFPNLCFTRKPFTDEKRESFLKKETIYKCSDCDYYSFLKCQVARHQKTHSTENEFRCSRCDFEANRIGHIRRHEKSHLVEELFQCTYCDFAAHERESVQNHEFIHEYDKEFQCSFCKFTTYEEEIVQRHESFYHIREGFFKCSHCDFRSFEKEMVEEHELVHIDDQRDIQEGEKLDFEMEDVGIPFRDHQTDYKENQSSSDSSMAVDESVVGSPNKKYACLEIFKCSLCKFESRYKQNIVRHQKSHQGKTNVPNTHHKENAQKSSAIMKVKLDCPFCDFTAFNKKDIERHECKNKNLFSNDFSRLQQKVIDSLIKGDIDAKNFECSMCDFQSKHRQSLERHQKMHQEKNNQNDVEQLNYLQSDPKPNPKDKASKFEKEELKEVKFVSSLSIFGDSNKEDIITNPECKNKVKFSSNNFPKKQQKAIDSDVEIFKCSLCSFKSKNKRYFRRHQKTHNKQKSENDDEQLKYPRRDRKPNLKDDFEEPENSSYREVEFACSFCNCKAFRQEDIRWQQYRGKYYFRKNEQKSTDRNYIGVKIYKCSSCDFQSKYEKVLNRHQKTHNGSESENSDDEFINYLRHRKTIMKEKTEKLEYSEEEFGCSFCEFRAGNEENIKRHECKNKNQSPSKFQTKKLKAVDSLDKCDTDVKVFKCSLCNYRSHYKSCFRRHQKLHPGKNDCNDVEQSKSPLKVETEKSGHNKGEFDCSYCDFRSCYKEDIKRHKCKSKNQLPRNFQIKKQKAIESEINVNFYKCSVCKFHSKYKRNVDRHQKAHQDYDLKTNQEEVVDEPEKSKLREEFGCSFCNFTTFCEEDIKRHECKNKNQFPNDFQTNKQKAIKSDINVNIFECSECDFKSKYKQNLERHLKSHKEKNHQNDVEQLKSPQYNRKTNLKEDAVESEDSESNVKVFDCSFCDFTAFREENLKKHKCKNDNFSPTRQSKIDTDVKMFNCSLCHLQFSHRYKLKRHQKTHHAKENQHNSEKKKSFQNVEKANPKEDADLSTLEESNDSSQVSIKEQPKASSSKKVKEAANSLNEIDKNVKTYACSLCDFKTKTKDILQMHKKRHKANKNEPRAREFESKQNKKKTFECTVCAFQTNLKNSIIRHELIHSDKKEFQCSYCPYRANRQDHIKKHERQHQKNTETSTDSEL